MTNDSVRLLSNEQLLLDLRAAAARERETTARLIELLSELDTRRLYLAEGYGSLFVYCMRCLHLSEHAAYGGIEAARAARQFPVILELLSDGSVTLTTVCLLARHLTAVFQNVYELRLPPNRMAILRPQWTTWHGTICARRDTRNTSAKTVNGDGHLNVIMES